MCAIIDANAAHQVFSDTPQPAGLLLLRWIGQGTYRLIVGGQLLRELEDNCPGFRQWASTAISAGRVRLEDTADVEERTQQLRTAGQCRSNDHHVIALAQISGARLLFTNDRDLQDDFGDRRIINSPRGKIYSTRYGTEVTRAHRDLLRRTDLCTR